MDVDDGRGTVSLCTDADADMGAIEATRHVYSALEWDSCSPEPDRPASASGERRMDAFHPTREPTHTGHSFCDGLMVGDARSCSDVHHFTISEPASAPMPLPMDVAADHCAVSEDLKASPSLSKHTGPWAVSKGMVGNGLTLRSASAPSTLSGVGSDLADGIILSACTPRPADDFTKSPAPHTLPVVCGARPYFCGPAVVGSSSGMVSMTSCTAALAPEDQPSFVGGGDNDLATSSISPSVRSRAASLLWVREQQVAMTADARRASWPEGEEGADDGFLTATVNTWAAHAEVPLASSASPRAAPKVSPRFASCSVSSTSSPVPEAPPTMKDGVSSVLSSWSYSGSWSSLPTVRHANREPSPARHSPSGAPSVSSVSPTPSLPVARGSMYTFRSRRRLHSDMVIPPHSAAGLSIRLMQQTQYLSLSQSVGQGSSLGFGGISSASATGTSTLLPPATPLSLGKSARHRRRSCVSSSGTSFWNTSPSPRSVTSAQLYSCDSLSESMQSSDYVHVFRERSPSRQRTHHTSEDAVHGDAGRTAATSTMELSATNIISSSCTTSSDIFHSPTAESISYYLVPHHALTNGSTSPTFSATTAADPTSAPEEIAALPPGTPLTRTTPSSQHPRRGLTRGTGVAGAHQQPPIGSSSAALGSGAPFVECEVLLAMAVSRSYRPPVQVGRELCGARSGVEMDSLDTAPRNWHHSNGDWQPADATREEGGGVARPHYDRAVPWGEPSGVTQRTRSAERIDASSFAPWAPLALDPDSGNSSTTAVAEEGATGFRECGSLEATHRGVETVLKSMPTSPSPSRPRKASRQQCDGEGSVDGQSGPQVKSNTATPEEHKSRDEAKHVFASVVKERGRATKMNGDDADTADDHIACSLYCDAEVYWPRQWLCKLPRTLGPCDSYDDVENLALAAEAAATVDSEVEYAPSAGLATEPTASWQPLPSESGRMTADSAYTVAVDRSASANRRAFLGEAQRSTSGSPLPIGTEDLPHQPALHAAVSAGEGKAWDPLTISCHRIAPHAELAALEGCCQSQCLGHKETTGPPALAKELHEPCEHMLSEGCSRGVSTEHPARTSLSATRGRDLTVSPVSQQDAERSLDGHLVENTSPRRSEGREASPPVHFGAIVEPLTSFGTWLRERSGSALNELRGGACPWKPRTGYSGH